ncbi:hypothetical protein AB0M22_36395 [Nocardia sp. NPDC051756]|uniref:hypothetical protein n=1 Tax=Nocardia sp. NPDC051756 TaxID=3154751 RepID=UPI0034488080
MERSDVFSGSVLFAVGLLGALAVGYGLAELPASNAKPATRTCTAGMGKFTIKKDSSGNTVGTGSGGFGDDNEKGCPGTTYGVSGVIELASADGACEYTAPIFEGRKNDDGQIVKSKDKSSGTAKLVVQLNAASGTATSASDNGEISVKAKVKVPKMSECKQLPAGTYTATDVTYTEKFDDGE